MKNKIEKTIFIILIFASVFSIVISKQANDLDELWNYNTARVISEGLIPYKDVSMITTPFYQFITAFFLKIFPNEMLTFRVLEALLWTAILYTIFKIMNLITNEENISAICACIVYLICKDTFCLDYNVFSLLLALIVLYFELRNIKNNKTFEDNFKYNILIGFLAGLVICTKQSIGTTTAIVVVLYNLVFVKNKDDFRKYIKIAFQRIMGILIPVAIMFIYLILNSAVKDFFDYAVFGISTFTNKIEYKTLFGSERREIRVLSRLMPISILISVLIIFMKKIKRKNTENNINNENTINGNEHSKTKNVSVTEFSNIENTINGNEPSKKRTTDAIEFSNKKNVENTTESTIILTILIYTFSVILVMYPISDEVHFMIGSVIPIINICYMIFLLIKKLFDKINFKKKKMLYKIISLIAFLVLFSIIVGKRINGFKDYSLVRKCTSIEYYMYIPMDEDYENRIKEVQEYINLNQKKGIKTYILDSEAALYTIPANVYNKNYDMFLKGNLGKDGEEGQIEKIKNDNEQTRNNRKIKTDNEQTKNNEEIKTDNEQTRNNEENINSSKEKAVYLLKKDEYELNWQTPMKVIDYVKQNMYKTGEIGLFDIYEK